MNQHKPNIIATQHPCELPPPESFVVASATAANSVRVDWRCPECGTKWRLRIKIGPSGTVRYSDSDSGSGPKLGWRVRETLRLRRAAS